MSRSPALQWHRLKSLERKRKSTKPSSQLTWTRSLAVPQEKAPKAPAAVVVAVAAAATATTSATADNTGSPALARSSRRLVKAPRLSQRPSSITKRLVSSVLKRAVAATAAAPRKTQQLCSYFVRTGSCRRAACPLVHDREKVAVCRAWLAGACRHGSGDACRLAHDYSETRMPDCNFFLQGICSKRKCPYRHVKLPEKTPPCGFFARGYCSSGNRYR